MDRIQAIKQQIRDAFGDIPFPEHLGINAAIAMDDWISDPQKLAKITKEKDVKGKWWEIPESEFKYMSLASCYFDAKATEFYLPAYMIVVLNDLNYPRYKCLLDWLKPGENDNECALYDSFKEQFSKIIDSKKDVCITVLEYIRDHLDQDDPFLKEGIVEITEILNHEFWLR